MAIGADRSSVLRMVLGRSLTLVLFGTAVGIAASLGAGQFLRAMFPSRSGIDFVAILLVVVTLLAITALAAYIPARRASRIEPTQALRYE
jgi:ABC-type antimicrobial peptide transport system permease subunit